MAETMREQLLRGEFVTVGGKIYALCRQCGSMIRINKPLIGSLHICEPPVEISCSPKEEK